MKLKIYITILALSVLACKKKSEDSPAPVKNEPIIINTPPDPACIPGEWIVQKHSGDTIEIKDGYLRLFAKHVTLNKFTLVQPICGTLIGDFEMHFDVPYLILSDSGSKGYINTTLSLPEGKSCGIVLTPFGSTIACQGSSYVYKPVTSKISHSSFLFKRTGMSLYAKLVFDDDSIETTYSDYGIEPLTFLISAFGDSEAKMATEAHIESIVVKSEKSSFKTDEFTSGIIRTR